MHYLRRSKRIDYILLLALNRAISYRKKKEVKLLKWYVFGVLVLVLIGCMVLMSKKGNETPSELWSTHFLIGISTNPHQSIHQKYNYSSMIRQTDDYIWSLSILNFLVILFKVNVLKISREDAKINLRLIYWGNRFKGIKYWNLVGQSWN